MGTVVIAMGSNIRPRRKALEDAIAALAALAIDHVIRCSRLYETEPVDAPGQNWFLNAAAVFDTPLDPHALMKELLAIEQRGGRERAHRNAPRTIDLDIILYNDYILTDPQCMIPHPRFRERGFVLLPLTDIIPGFADPETGLTIRTLLQKRLETETAVCRPIGSLSI